MDFDLDQRTATLSVGELADFSVGPRDSSGGATGLWRAQIGTHWHQQLRLTAMSAGGDPQFEVPVEAMVMYRGWRISLTGRIDQILPTGGPGGLPLLREIKTVSRSLPESEDRLRSEYPGYFSQISAYLALRRVAQPGTQLAGQLMFVEIGTGVIQTVGIHRTDEDRFTGRLEVLAVFLDLRLRARERLRTLRIRPPFTQLRAGQESTRADLETALERSRFVAFEAPTGFGKTGLMLECALGRLRAGRYSRILYLTSKSTGQLQVVRTLQTMTSPSTGDDTTTGSSLAVWQVRAKVEHCVNPIYHCVSESCAYIADAEARWPASGLQRFYLIDGHARDLDSLRAAGRDALICPYEITRTALAFNDVWVGDYNYVFAPRNRGIFYEQPGFDPAQTLLILDEAHNLPSRAADARSYVARAEDAHAVLAELDHQQAGAAMIRAWTSWTHLLAALPVAGAMDLAMEDDIADTLRRVAEQVVAGTIDFASLAPGLADRLWETLELAEWMKDASIRTLLWSPRPGELRFTCIDASASIGETLRAYGGVLLASATLGPLVEFAEAIGLAADTEGLPGEALTRVEASTPWREGTYRVAYDLRVDTRFRQRAAHAATTAATVERLHAAAGTAIVVFFPSYRYAEMIERALADGRSLLRIAVQPKLSDLAAQAAWVDESLVFADALFLVLGSSFAESIDYLGGRITHAMVVGPALPEVNAVQQARLETLGGKGSEAAFRRVYQIPGMQKVNQALGRLVRAPGHHASVLLHCRRFAETSYASLLAPDYQFGTNLLDDADLEHWLTKPA